MGQIFVRASRRAKAYFRHTKGSASYNAARSFHANNVAKKLWRQYASSLGKGVTPRSLSLERRYGVAVNTSRSLYKKVNKYA